MLSLNMSLRLLPHPFDAVESEVRLYLARHKMQEPLYAGQMSAMLRGLPLDKNIKAQAAPAEPAAFD